MNVKGRVFACLALVVAVSASSLEIRDGRVKLVLHEEIGKYTLYYLDDLQKNTYTPLFVDVDPRTSGTSVVVDNRILRLGETSEFEQQTARTGSGAQFVWTSRKLQVVQDFQPITSPGSQLADGLKMTLTVKNLGEADQSVGIRLLLDTHLGEEDSAHFTLGPGAKVVTRETEYISSNMIQHWVSGSSRNEDAPALVSVTVGEGITTPDRIIFANWQRLNDSSWAFQTSGTRNFSNLPYSINDSAVAQYYNPRTVEAGDELSVVAVMGYNAARVYDLTGAADTSADSGSRLLDSVTSTSNIADPVLAVRADLQVVERLLESVSEYLADTDSATEENIEFLQEVLEELRNRAASYTDR